MSLEQTIREACPASWDLEQWDRFVFVLREWWPEPVERWTERRIMGLALGVADFSSEQVGDALRRLRDSGHKFPPRVPEIADAIKVDRSAPSWTEAHALLFDRPGGVIHARAPRRNGALGEDARRQLRDEAMLERAAELHPMIAAFTAAYGPRRLDDVSGRIAYTADYRAIELERLREEWEDFAQRAEARRREGLPLLTAPLDARRRELGPVRPDYAAAITAGTTTTTTAGSGA